MTEIITSRNNKTVTEAGKLKDKKYRDQTGLYCFEGRKLFLEACHSGIHFHSIFVTEKYQNEHSKTLDSISCPLYTVTNNVYSKLSDDRAPDGIFCIASKQSESTECNNIKFILSSVRDPGNLGTAIRCARAFGVGTLILHDCADEYNPKVIRASMGSFFRQNIAHTDRIEDTISELRKQGYIIYPAALTDTSRSLQDIIIDEKTVFIVGNEGHGISPDVISACGNSVIIPMPGDTESLNASVAASILMWEQSKIISR